MSGYEGRVDIESIADPELKRINEHFEFQYRRNAVDYFPNNYIFHGAFEDMEKVNDVLAMLIRE